MISPDKMEKLAGRYSRAWERASSWHSRIKEVYRYVLPEREQTALGSNDPGSYATLYDSTGSVGVSEFASFVSEALYPFDGKWFRFGVREGVDASQHDDLLRLAERRTQVVNFLISTSNFQSAILAANKDLAISTRFLKIEIDPYNPLRIVFSAVLPTSMAVDEDSFGRISGIFSKHTCKARDLNDVYGHLNPSWNTTVNQNIVNHPDKDVELCTSLIRDTVGWTYVLWVQNDHSNPAAVAKYKTPPIICTRWSSTVGQPWGVGPALTLLPDIKTANKTVELILKNASIACTGIWQAEDDGVLNPATVQLVPGAIIPKAMGSSGLVPLQAPGRFDVSQLVLDDIRSRINTGLFVVKLPERRMTAYEASERTREQQRTLRGVFGQLRSEDVQPIIDRVADLAEQMGLLSSPVGIEQVLELELIGPLAQAIKEQEAKDILGARMFIAQAWGPMVADRAIKPAEAVAGILERMGIPSVMWNGAEAIRAESEKFMELANQFANSQTAGQVPVPGMPGTPADPAVMPTGVR